MIVSRMIIYMLIYLERAKNISQNIASSFHLEERQNKILLPMYCYVCTDILFFFRYMGLFDCDLPFQIDCKEGSDVGYV